MKAVEEYFHVALIDWFDFFPSFEHTSTIHLFLGVKGLIFKYKM